MNLITIFLSFALFSLFYQSIKFFLLLILLNSAVAAIDCFKCVSINGKNSMCEDPFHNNYSSEILESPCWAGRKNRNGIFPATACIKLSGTFEDSGVSMVVRDCALDSGSLTTDTELVRMSHCGAFYFDGNYVSGCVQSCFEDACADYNSATFSFFSSSVFSMRLEQ